MSYYNNKLEEASEYQDFVVEEMFKIGIPICLYSSRKKQLHAESFNGYEIKYDKKFRNTKRLFIETHEKTNHDNSNWIESGILKDDNTLFYIIGDYKDIFILSKKQLAIQYKKGLWNRHEGQTTKGMFLDIKNGNILNEEFNFLVIKHIKIK